jgi:hypothetical protein
MTRLLTEGENAITEGTIASDDVGLLRLDTIDSLSSGAPDCTLPDVMPLHLRGHSLFTRRRLVAEKKCDN